MRSLLTICISAALLLGCQTQQSSPVVEGNAAQAGLQVRVLTDAEVVSGTAVNQQRVIADILYEALQALDEDRLLTPIDDNAHARFMRVLAYDFDNSIALEGIQDIVTRYLQLSRESMYRGQFEESRIMLDRASFVDSAHPLIEVVSQELQQEMKSGDLFFDLDYREFSRRSELAQNQLEDIARQAKQNNAFFLITVPNDDLARWMVSIMRGAVPGHRLRGNIELASRSTIRLRMPSNQ